MHCGRTLVRLHGVRRSHWLRFRKRTRTCVRVTVVHVVEMAIVFIANVASVHIGFVSAIGRVDMVMTF